MRYTTKTEYGLICMVYMAKQIEKEWITIKEIAKEENYSFTYIEKILKHLQSEYGLDLLFLEGAIGALNPALLSFFSK